MRFRLTLLAGFLTLVPPHAQSRDAPTQEPSIAVRAVRRLVLEMQSPYYSVGPAGFELRRRDNTHGSSIVHFEISGTAMEGTDYFRSHYDPGTVVTGRLQTVVFKPGQDRVYVVFQMMRDDNPEARSRFIRLEVIPPPEGETPYQVQRRRCATVWIVPATCSRPVSTPGGGYACLQLGKVKIPKAFFTTARCR